MALTWHNLSQLNKKIRSRKRESGAKPPIFYHWNHNVTKKQILGTSSFKYLIQSWFNGEMEQR